MNKILYLGVMVLAIASCKKEDEVNTEDPQATPTFDITTPTPLQSFQFGDTIKITGTISANEDMHGYNVRLMDQTNGMNVVNQGYHEHASNFVINESWVNSTTDTTYYKVIIDAAIDHEGNMATEERAIICYPQ